MPSAVAYDPVTGEIKKITGVAKAVLEAAQTDPRAIDWDFIERYTSGFDAYRAACATVSWAELEHQSGVDEAKIREVAAVYLRANRTIVSWCLGITQQEHGVDTVREIVNLLLRGNLGREGAGPCPIRGHSTVQGNRTCGIDHRPGEQLLDRLVEVCGIDAPREHGLDVVGTIEAMHRGDVR